MRCPYCVSEIPDEALVCAVCRRDLYVVRPLLERIAALEAQLAAAPAVQPAEAAGVDVAPQEAVAEPPREWGRALACWLAPLLLLLAAHWLIVFAYDARVLYLRIFALLVPLPFGFAFARAARLPFAWGLLPAFAMAAAAVFGMSAVTAAIDGAPLWPQNMAEVREFVEFAASIGFSFITGLWVRSWLERRREVWLRRQRAVGLSAVNGQQMAESLTRLNDIGSAVVAFATTAFSIYTGLKGFLGG